MRTRESSRGAPPCGATGSLLSCRRILFRAFPFSLPWPAARHCRCRASRARPSFRSPICNDSGPGSFRDAVAAAADGDTLDVGATPFCAIRVTSEVVVPQDNLAIRGRSGNRVIIETFIRTSRLIRHTGTGTLSFFGVALDSGRVAGPLALGGCVLSEGHVELDTS